MMEKKIVHKIIMDSRLIKKDYFLEPFSKGFLILVIAITFH